MFIVIEGPDGVGKSSFATELFALLNKNKKKWSSWCTDVKHIREPINMFEELSLKQEVNNKVNKASKYDQYNSSSLERMNLENQVYLYLQCRRSNFYANINHKYINSIIVCERWHPSTVVYQGMMNGFGFCDTVRSIERFLPFVPDIYIYIHADPEKIYEINKKREGELENIKIICSLWFKENYKNFNKKTEEEKKQIWIKFFATLTNSYDKYFSFYDCFKREDRLYEIKNDFKKTIATQVKIFVEEWEKNMQKRYFGRDITYV